MPVLARVGGLLGDAVLAALLVALVAFEVLRYAEARARVRAELAEHH